ncbi:MAG: hypothetical protein DIZ80_01785 [endosymbiont of Galathealinum brachiosum]|uniref:Diguanylate cyclase n=1 Tax=endosymbiont of Galathealinum brachiosum TaxID=2200906 RepID=A0A370DLA3_9GAMM|nr:MAG: hypothetical protein DIZ80_01785 [endosymbiont of Galathealinum brachiosum]
MPKHNKQSNVEIKRREYNKFVAAESIEDYALRYSPSSFRNWSEFLVANTALGSISFLALEAIGASIAITYGIENAFWGILAASIIIFLMGFPICYHAAKYNIDIDLLTRAAGFGYLGSTITSLIYASFCFIFFAIEASIMAQALLLYTGLPLYIGYALCSIIIIPIVFYGMTAINRLQLITLPIWLTLMILPFVMILLKEPDLLTSFFNFSGTKSGSSEFSFYHFGFALGISLALIAQIGEQVDYLRFMPDKKKENRFKWWFAVILAGPGWVVLGFLKQIGGILLAALVLLGGASIYEAREPIYMYNAAYTYVFENPSVALSISFIFVILSQIKINVTNAYAGSLAWSNFFSRVTHSHPGRVVWLVFNITIALILMEIGVFDVLEKILGLYSNIAIAWIAAIVADLVINKPLGLSPPMIEFKRAHLFKINPVGVFSTLIASIISVIAFSGLLGEQMQAFSSIIALVIAFILSPIIAIITRGKYYIARESLNLSDQPTHICGVCGIQYATTDMASCRMYQSNICSLCCTLESRCHDSCKDKPEFSLREKAINLVEPLLEKHMQQGGIRRLISFLLIIISLLTATGFILWTTYMVRADGIDEKHLIAVQNVYINLFFISSILYLIIAWLVVLFSESRRFVESELTHKNLVLENEIYHRSVAEENLHNSEERYHSLLELSPTAIIAINEHYNIVLFNKAAERTFGYSGKEVINHPLDKLLPVTHHNIHNSLIDEYKNSNQDYVSSMSRQPITVYKKNGDELNIEVSLSKIKLSGNFLMTAAITDITSRLKADKKILHQANFDTLTDLPNRFLSLDRLSQLLHETERNDEKVAVLFLDLDDFKKVNDTLGHETGDNLLIEAAHRLNSVVRTQDTVGRLGGDEFIILLGGLINATDAQPIAENLLEQFRKAFRIENRELILTASIGIAIYPGDGKDASELLRNADSAMYNSKDHGRNTYTFFTDAMNKEALRRLALEEQIHGALDRGEFEIYYQAKMNISSGKIMGAEALLRWHNKALKNVSPDEFIPVAEQTGLILPIGEFVLTEAINKTSIWREKHNTDYNVAINLSPRQFRDPNLVSFIEKTLKQSRLPNHLIELEITEGVLMSGHSYIDTALDELHKLGLKISMDDFGTGYSSLSYLRSYPFNVLKIDRSFINDITNSKADLELVNAAIAMAHGLNLKVVAEGVETEQQLSLLKDLKCDYAQGYLFSKPLPADEFERLLESTSN